MMWVYAVILAFSAGLCTFVLSRAAGRILTFFGITAAAQNVLSFAGLSALGFLMVAQTPAMMLTCALVLWFAGTRHEKTPLSFFVQVGLIILTVMLGIAALDSPNFNLPAQIPKAAIMFAVYIVWCLVMALPLGSPGNGLLASYGLALVIFVVGAVALHLPASLAGDAIVIGGALIGAYFATTLSNSHHGLAGQWVLLYLLGFLAATAAYAGFWWLGLLGIAPVCVYALVRKA